MTRATLPSRNEGGPTRWELIEQLAALAREVHDEPTRAALLLAIVDEARKGQEDGPRGPSFGERLVAVLPDVATVVALATLAGLRVLNAELVAGLALAVVTARLYPRRAPAHGGSDGGGVPPSAIVTLGAWGAALWRGSGRV